MHAADALLRPILSNTDRRFAEPPFDPQVAHRRLAHNPADLVGPECAPYSPVDRNGIIQFDNKALKIDNLRLGAPSESH